MSNELIKVQSYDPLNTIIKFVVNNSREAIKIHIFVVKEPVEQFKGSYINFTG